MPERHHPCPEPGHGLPSQREEDVPSVRSTREAGEPSKRVLSVEFVSDTIAVLDPTYGLDAHPAQYHIRVHPGAWQAEVQETFVPDWGPVCSAVQARLPHSAGLERSRERLTILVDGGMIVVADSMLLDRAVQAAPSPGAIGRVFMRPFSDALMALAEQAHAARGKDRCARSTAQSRISAAVIPGGLVVLPGFGDGNYEAFIVKDDKGIAIAVECVFVLAEQAKT
jgi:hypothetical protein